jgi:hypothetical protein
MLPDRISRLLSAYVDDELGARQREAVERLLGKSPEARTLLERLRSDADRVRNLPRAVLDGDFARRLVRQIDEAAARPAEPVPAVVRFRWPAWVSVASAAAAVLVAVGLGTALYFGALSKNNAQPHPFGGGDPLVQRQPEKPEPPDLARAVPKHEPVPAPVVEAPKTSRPPEPRDTRPKMEVAKTTTPPSPPLVAPPAPPMESFRTPEIPVSLFVKLRELDQQKVRDGLLKELREGETYRVELRCAGNAVAMERLQAVLAGQGIRLSFDSLALSSLTLALRTDFALYAENVTPTDVLEVLARLSVEDGRADARRRKPALYEQAVVTHLRGDEQRLVGQALGVEAPRLEAPLPRSRRKVDARKPLAAQTSEQVVGALQGQGGAGAHGRAALVVTYDPARQRRASKEIEQFLDARPERQPGTVQVLWIVHRVGK